MNMSLTEVYQIKVRGRLDARWSDWFGGMVVTCEVGGDGIPISTITGPVADQAALRGILSKLLDLNLKLVSVIHINTDWKEPRLDMKGELKMANTIQTLEGLTTSLRGRVERIPARNALFISVGVILLRWLASTITKVSTIQNGLDRIGSLEQLSVSALANGAVTVLGVTLLLYLSRETYRDVGFRRHHVLGQLGLGFLFGVGIFALDIFLIGPLVEALLPKTSPEGIDMGVLFSSAAYVPVWLMMALLKGGFAEELWRTFTLTRFEKCFGKAGLVFALTASSVMFGLGHLYQGLGTVIANAIQGLLYALVYLRKRSAWEAVSAHAVFDLIAITLGFVIYSG